MPQDSSCTKCRLHMNARSVCIFGRQVGSTASKIMVIGEAPGFQEDQQGRPFVGPSGKLLADALEKVGITDYYLTNVVKCISSGAPSSTEISACRSYLQEELEAVKPQYILALGNSAWHFFGSGAISEHASREMRSEKYSAWVMPAYHPAAILRNPNNERGWRGDLARFAQLVQGTLIDEVPGDVHMLTRIGWSRL